MKRVCISLAAALALAVPSLAQSAANVASSKTGDGPIPDGAAISIVNRAGYGNVGTVTIEGTPTLIAQGEGATAVAAYTWNGNTQSDWAEASEHVAISGGTFSQKPDDALLAPDFVLVENQDGTFGVASAYVASIGDVKYADFNSFFTAFQAIEASETPTTVTLLTDLTGDLAVPGVVPVAAGQNIVFDLNGHTMETALQREGRHYYAIDNYGTLTIKDSSTEQTGTIRARGVENLGNGKLTIESGTIVSVDANGGACIWNEADVTVKGGTFTTEFVGTPSDEFGPGCLNNSGTALVTGGTFHNVNRRTYAIISNTGSIEITPAEGSEVKVFGAHGGLGVDGGTAVVNGGTYSSSDFYGLYVSNDGLGADPMQAAVTVNGGTFDGKSYSVWVGSDYNDPVNSTIAIKGGTFLKPLHRQDVSRPDAIQVSGGTFSEKPDNAWFADGFIPVENEDGTFGVIEGTYVAAIGEVKYASLQAAFDAATATDTIKLLSTATDTPRLTLTNGKTVSIDLNGHDIGFVQNGRFQVNGGKLTLTGEGRVYEQAPYFGPILIMGSTEDIADYSVVDVGKDVTLEGWAPLFIDNNAGCAYGVKVTMAGTANSVKDIAGAGGHGVYINGSIKKIEGNVPQITLTETSKVTSLGNGIYAAGYAHWMLAGDISGSDALSIKSGTFIITGGDYLGTGSFADSAEAHGNGSENTGAAVTITTNDNYAQAPIVVNITGGDFISTNGYALYEGIAKTSDGTPAAEASAAVIAITGGDFTGSKTNVAVTADISITTAKNPRVISGGTFSKPIPEALCALGYVPVDTPNAEGKYTVEHPLFTKVGVQMADGSYKVYDSMYAACYDTTMIAQEGVTGTIIVLEDIEFDSYFRVLAGQNVTFDLNGHTVTCTGGGFSYAIDWVCNDDITAKPTVTITDSSIGQTGVLRSDGPYLDGLVRMVGGKLNITGGRFVQDVDNPNAQYKGNITVLTEGLTVDPEPGRTVEFSGGTIRVESNAATSVQNFGTAIKGGLFHSSEGRPAIEVAHVTQGLVVSGGSFEGDGKAILISAPATITISGGDFTDDIVAIENAGATVKLSGGVFENAVFTGSGTLDVNPAINDLSMASVDTSLGKLMLAGDLDIGTNRLPNTTVEISASATVSMDAVEKELEIGKVNVFSAGDQMEAPQNLTLTVGNLLATQTLVEPTISVENDTIVLTFLAVPTELVGSEAFLAYLRQEDLGSIVSVTGTTKGGTVALTATELNEALSVFRLTNDLFTLGDTDGGKTLVVDYDFGITDVRVQRDTGDLVVTVAVQNAAAEPLAFADGVTFSLCNGEAALEATPATVDGVTTLTVPAVNLPAGVLRLSVSVAPAAEVETPAE